MPKRILKAGNWVLQRSVFRKMPKETAMDTLLAQYFHRLAATMYFAYTVWAVVSIVQGIPTIRDQSSDYFQILFSAIIFSTAGPACFGAAFWPSFARLEMAVGSSFTVVLTVYLYFILQNIFFGDGTWPGLVLIASVLVLPVCRSAIVAIFLLRQARQRKAEVAAVRALLVEGDI